MKGKSSGNSQANMISPCVRYLDEVSGSNALAARPRSSKEGSRPRTQLATGSGAHISAIGALLQERITFKGRGHGAGSPVVGDG